MPLKIYHTKGTPPITPERAAAMVEALVVLTDNRPDSGSDCPPKTRGLGGGGGGERLSLS